jgi:CO/xanthine dehydrogenase Mo-binding subunit
MAAVGNAIYNATGVVSEEFPFGPSVFLAALKAAGV